jgi:hypothetical protein
VDDEPKSPQGEGEFALCSPFLSQAHAQQNRWRMSSRRCGWSRKLVA